MDQMNEFDRARAHAAQALMYSRQWLTKPLETADRYMRLQLSAGSSQTLGASQVDVQSTVLRALCLGRWAMSGYPTITIGHRTAAAFMTTRIKPDDAAEFVRSPWPAFAVRIPNGLLAIECQGQICDPGVLIATCIPADEFDRVIRPSENSLPGGGTHRWWYQLCARSPATRPKWLSSTQIGHYDGVSLWGFNMPTEFLATEDGGASEDGYQRWDGYETMDSDTRCDRLARTLIVAACLQLSGTPEERASRNSPSGITVRERKSKKREGDELPQYTDFEVTSSIKINLHHAVREFIERGGSAPSVQTLVAGHWKRQVFGSGRLQRRLIHVHPYWRGELDAPISARMK